MNIEKLNTWYQLNCDGDWEHSYGIEIGTMDNPGWFLKIDLKGTALEGTQFKERIDINDDNWYEVKVKNDVFIGYCSHNNFDNLTELFVKFLEEKLPSSNGEYQIYAPLFTNDKLNKFWRPMRAKMIGLNRFEITSYPSMEEVNLNMKDLSDLDYIDDLDRSLDSLYKVGEIVECKLMKFFDYPGLVITAKLTEKKQESSVPPQK